MMRAALVVISVVTLAFMELRTPPRVAQAAKADPDKFEQLTIATSVASDALQEADRKGDRLDVARAQAGSPAQQILFAERLAQPEVKAQPAVKAAVPLKKAKAETKLEAKPKAKAEAKSQAKAGEHNKHVANDHKAAIAKPKPKPAQIAAAKPATPDRSKAASNKPANEIKSCRPNAFERLLNTLNLPSGCET